MFDKIHEKDILVIFGTLGNLDKSAAAKGDELYYKLVANGANVLSSDRNVEAGKQLMKYATDKKLKSKHIVIKKI